jgi:ribonuclease HII
LQPALDGSYERACAQDGAHVIVGVDEVGRGALIGPVVAAAVALPWWDGAAVASLADVRDSKRMSGRARCTVYDVISSVALAVGVGRASPTTIDALGIAQATALAMRRAVRSLTVVPDIVLIDGMPVDIGAARQRSIVKGDQTVLSIAAASVVAKVVRDAGIIELGQTVRHYGLSKNKGYGAPAHLRALCVRGPTVHHRLTWSPLQRAGSLANGLQGLSLLELEWSQQP